MIQRFFSSSSRRTAGLLALVVVCVAGNAAAQQTSTAVRPLPHLTYQGRLAQGQALAQKLGADSTAAPDAPTIAVHQM
jgi:hypothetical protein